MRGAKRPPHPRVLARGFVTQSYQPWPWAGRMQGNPQFRHLILARETLQPIRLPSLRMQRPLLPVVT